MLTTIITAHNNVNTITKAIRTAGQYSKRIIVVDFNSTDATLELIRLHPLVEYITTKEKHAYLDLLNYNDWFLLLKGSEQLVHIEPDKFKEPYNYLKIECLTPKRVDFLYEPRLFRYKPGIKFVQNAAQNTVQVGFNSYNLKSDREVVKSPVGLIRSQPINK